MLYALPLLLLMTGAQLVAMFFVLPTDDALLNCACRLPQAIVLTSLLLVPAAMLPGRWREAWLWLCFCAVGLVTLVDLFLLLNFRCEYYRQHLALFLGSNGAEICECLKTYITRDYIIAAVFALGVPAVVYVLLTRPDKPLKAAPKGSQWTLALSVAATAALWIAKPEYGLGGIPSLPRLSYDLFSYPYSDHPSDAIPEISVDEGPRPQLIVLVIGESVARSHCSLYGYPLPTTPCLSSLAEDSSTIVFTDAVSPYINTPGSFKLMMTTAHSLDDAPSWTERPTLPLCARAAGYRTVWCSNQKRAGIWENVQGQFAAQCDTAIWTSNELGEIMHYSLDEALLPEIKLVTAVENVPTLLIVNMIGCHEYFSDRYPADFAHFTPSDYPQFPEEQRQNRAEYDNAVLYTDHIVSQIYRILEDREALLIFTPDHGMDVYETYPYYCGHAMPCDARSYDVSIKVPLMVMQSPLMSEHFPNVSPALQVIADTPYNTADLIYLILSLMNARL